MSKVTPQPKIGFVSLGCPKNLVDSERILTELRTEGYDVVPSYDDADMVIVNTCGFIDSAVQESLEAIGEALNENGKVIVTGCLGAKEDQIREVHPKVRSSLRAKTETQPIPEPGARTRCETDAASLCLSENF